MVRYYEVSGCLSSLCFPSLTFSFFSPEHRRPFVRPTSSTPVVVRAISFSGEYHPVLRKRVIVVPVSQLPLTSPEARHKFKVLAGPRWSELPPRDSGIGREEHDATGLDGYVKLSCEDFPEAEMNLKWTLDVLKRLMAEAHVCRYFNCTPETLN